MNKSIFFILFFLLASSTAFAATTSPLDDVSIISIMTHAMAPATNLLLTQSLKWLAIFASIQFIITNFALLKSGADIEVIIGKLIGTIAWLSFCVYVLNHGPAFIGDVGDQFFHMLGMTLPSPGAIMLSTIALVSSLAVMAAAVGVASTTSGMLIVYILIFLFAVGMFFAIKIFMLQLELGLVVMLSPLSFAFLGLDALKDQGIAPFKALISLGYRIILITIILSAFTEVGNAVTTTLQGFSAKTLLLNGVGSFVMTILAALGAYMMLGYVLFKSDSIAASLAGGSTSMGTGDVASAAAMGAAAGAAVATGGASVAEGAATRGQSMGDFIKSLSGGGAMQNESPTGVGGMAEQKVVGTPPPPAPKKPEMSLQEMRNHPSASRNQGQAKSGSASPAAEMTPNQSMAAQSSAGQAPSNAQAITDSLNSMPGSSKPTSPAKTSSGSGSGEAAGIGGAPSETDQKLDKLMESMSKTSKPSFGDRVATVNDHVAKEQAATHVSINTNASD